MQQQSAASMRMPLENNLGKNDQLDNPGGANDIDLVARNTARSLKERRHMTRIIFWEKPGCQGNRRQKEILIASGHELEVRDLLKELWDQETLSSFFGEQPIVDCFNPTNPQIKSGELIPTETTRQEALDIMVADPLLIVRPLMQVGCQRLAGFDVRQVHNWVGLALASVGERDPKNCPCVTTAA